MSVDPLAEKYPDVTPYHYTHNNPINKFDPDGRFEVKANNHPFGYGDYIVTRYTQFERMMPGSAIGNYFFGNDPAYVSTGGEAFYDAVSIGASAAGASIGSMAGKLLGSMSKAMDFAIATKSLGDPTSTIEATLFNVMEGMGLGKEASSGPGLNSTFYLNKNATQGLKQPQVEAKVKALAEAIRKKGEKFDLTKRAGQERFQKFVKDNKDLFNELQSIWEDEKKDEEND